MNRTKVTKVLCAFAVALVVAVWLVAGNAGPAFAQGSALVDETFTGATAEPRFIAFGSACLTGAAGNDVPPPAGDHALDGCGTPGAGPVPPTGAAPLGYLQLTDAGTDQAGAVLFNQPIPANQGLAVTFDQWQYGGNPALPPADGISFFLVDGAGELFTPGPFGGSLGYAQKTLVANDPASLAPGVSDGYLGIGLDVLGNFFGDAELRGNGCPPDQQSPGGTDLVNLGPNKITVRGPGNGVEGYCFLTATTSNFTTTGPWPSTLPGNLQGPTTAVSTDPAQAQADLEPSRRTVRIRISPAPDPVVTVDVDFNDGNGFQQVLSFPAPQPVPSTYLFGFAASTGDFTDVHLIRNVVVESAEPLPSLNLVKQVSTEPPLPPVIGVGTVVPYEFVVTNSGPGTVTDLTVSDPMFPVIACPTTTLTATPPGNTTTCTASYTVTAADVALGYLSNTAFASGRHDDTPVTSPPDMVELPLGGAVSLSLEKQADTSRTYQLGEVVDYTYVVTNTSDEPVTGLVIDDDRISGATCEATTLGPVSDPATRSTVCTGSTTVTQADVIAGRITNVAQAVGIDGGVVSPPATVTVVVAAPAPPSTPEGPVLPVTGVSLGPVVAVALALAFGGLALLARSRRTRAPEDEPR